MTENYWRNKKDKIWYFRQIFRNFLEGLLILSGSKAQKKIHNYLSHEKRLHYSVNEPLFNAIFFEVRSRCNSTCSFCAAAIQSETRPDITMPFDMFKKVVDELRNLNYQGFICFHVNNDPLLVKDIDQYVEYAKKKCPTAWVQLVTNGKSLNNKNGENLITAGVDEILINVYSKENDRKTPPNIMKFEKDVLHKHFEPSDIKSGSYSKKNIATVGKEISYNKFTRLLEENLSNRAGNNPAADRSKSNPNFGFCEYPFEQFNIDASGNVSTCCADFYFSENMGNVSFQSVEEIWYGKKFKAVRKSLMETTRAKGTLCDGCDSFGVSLPSNSFRKTVWKLFVK